MVEIIGVVQRSGADIVDVTYKSSQCGKRTVSMSEAAFEAAKSDLEKFCPHTP